MTEQSYNRITVICLLIASVAAIAITYGHIGWYATAAAAIAGVTSIVTYFYFHI